ncbi:MAG: hypothetical protein HYZ26_11715 [Chloroflexi bacterium]|nr:hypothetical protein [Chloroflexota bacterium]
MRNLFKTLFLLAVAGGTFTGWALMRGLRAEMFPTPTPAQLTTALPNQVNALFVGLTDLDDRRAVLLSAWLVTYRPEEAEIDLLPVYPVHPAMQLGEYEAAHSPIEVDGNDIAALGDLDVIAAQRLHWDVLVVLDETALEELLRLVEAGGAGDARLFRGRPAEPWEQPAALRDYQEALLSLLCEQRAGLAAPAAWLAASDLYPGHLNASVGRGELEELWQALAAAQPRPDCAFPLSGLK